MNTKKDILRWNRMSWVWVLLCALGIFATVPVARSFQKYVYTHVGKEFFTYFVLSMVCIILAVLLYSLVFKLKVKNVSQYIWLTICAGVYIYLTVGFRKHPEEAIHLLEFGLLAFFVFKALSCKIRDWTVYLSSALIVSFAGAIDEFLQWLTPGRVWDFRDVNTNMLSGCIFLVALWKGIRPEIINRPVRKLSVNVLAGVFSLNLIFLGLCLSNTPEVVQRYTSAFDRLSWLRSEETMAEYGYAHIDPEIGTVFSRMSIEEMKKNDSETDLFSEKMFPEDISSEAVLKELFETYSPYTNKFMYEFLMHVSRRDDKFNDFKDTNLIDNKHEAFKKNQILEKYFGMTLEKSIYKWPAEKIEALGDTASLRNKDYTSKAGKLITSFNVRTVWLCVLVMLGALWTFGAVWKRRID
jgi:hypothetical protein